jgi:arsenical pump membrane protein
VERRHPHCAGQQSHEQSAASLIAGSVIAADGLPAQITDAMLIGADVGPKLSVTGSLATIFWLAALRRDRIEVGIWNFLRLGALVMRPL